ncbi:response regulator [Glutamicibacter protophormiae]|uniref:response regulator n=1 Tax=Glutamicibacter protophormiae TaxID=37930 RepID=UPI003A8DE63E
MKPATRGTLEPVADNGEEHVVAAVTVLIADDQKVVRDGLAVLLELLDGVTVIGTAVDGTDAVEQAVALDPDVVLMDLHMPNCSGVEATEKLVAMGSRSRIVVLTTYTDDIWVFAALKAGARGFLTKDAGAGEILHAIVTVAQGEAQLDPSVQRRLLEALAGRSPIRISSEANLDNLTPREVEVLSLIAAGRSNSEIANELFVSDATVKTHVNHLLAKTTMRDRAQLVGYAFHHGITQL